MDNFHIFLLMVNLTFIIITFSVLFHEVRKYILENNKKEAKFSCVFGSILLSCLILLALYGDYSMFWISDLEFYVLIGIYCVVIVTFWVLSYREFKKLPIEMEKEEKNEEHPH